MLDWNRINELRGEVGDDEFQLILELFLDEVEGVIMRLSRRDVLQLETDLHFLKGCAWNLGFVDFGNLCDAGERKAAGGRGPGGRGRCRIAAGQLFRVETGADAPAGRGAASRQADAPCLSAGQIRNSASTGSRVMSR
ncbi:Hpt domain-containing protein [Paracoccus pantotrophus]|uniref:Hpt domain-containing protein n=1 Tax=Paracoccus pantotrophus TaxID=82367 RepID=A0ABX9SGH4_PARPN|nr:Hpt domain-containing protein [Paracoccus pantotrophus]RKS52684.1 Hpt domain-containing protein [Paracoccus pantotrophus]